jgi:hypothetical protein
MAAVDGSELPFRDMVIVGRTTTHSFAGLDCVNLSCFATSNHAINMHILLYFLVLINRLHAGQKMVQMLE